jgi:hypothetical protein
MGTKQGKTTSRVGLLGGQTGEPVDDGDPTLPFLDHGAFEAEDLCDPVPVTSKVLIEIRAGGQRADFDAPMTFRAGGGAAPG